MKIIESDSSKEIIISFFIHFILILLLFLIKVKIENNRNYIEIISNSEEIVIQDEIIELNSEIFSEDLTLLSSNIDSKIQIDSKDIDINLNHSDFFENNHEESFLIDSKDLNQNVKTTEDTVSHETSITGVLDRITLEIINNSQEKDLNVIWLFDASISLSNQRKNIKDRIEKIFKEISLSKTKKINHIISCFGQNLNIITKKPTNDISEVIKDIESIPLDESGIENVFGSVIELCMEYRRQKNIVIIFTDEVGDDILNLEKCAMTARRNGTIIYVVGPPSPFGSSKIQFKYVDPDPNYDQTEKWVEINQGPETLFKMTLDIKSLPVDELGLDSGFGPYALTRLCQNTGGIYFSVHPNRNKELVSKKHIEPLSSNINVFFEKDVMTKYLPDYGNYSFQLKDIENNKIKLALIKACEIPLFISNDQILNFPAEKESEFVNKLSEAQKWSAKLEPQIDKIYLLLSSVESFSDKLKENRWIASYYLAMGRILSTKCRVEAYNQMLSEAKSGLKKSNPKNNIWKLEPSEEFEINNTKLKKLFESSNYYLKYVVDNFPNTPWEFIAKEELKIPKGYKWKDDYRENKETIENSANNNNPPADDIKRKLDYKPKRKIDKI